MPTLSGAVEKGRAECHCRISEICWLLLGSKSEASVSYVTPGLEQGNGWCWEESRQVGRSPVLGRGYEEKIGVSVGHTKLEGTSKGDIQVNRPGPTRPKLGREISRWEILQSLAQEQKLKPGI